jgi:hypothetical protein
LGRSWCPYCGAHADSYWKEFHEVFHKAGGKYDDKENPVTINCVKCGTRIMMYLEVEYNPKFYRVPIKSVCGLNKEVSCYRASHYCAYTTKYVTLKTEECEHYQESTEQEDTS